MHSTHIAGIPHRNPDLSLLSVGDEVTLISEPDNKFDPNAIKVYWKLHNNSPFVHLGYIPRDETPLLSGVSSMWIVEIAPDRRWKEVVISTEKPK